MNKEITSLELEKERLIEQLRPIEEKINEIDRKITDIRSSCPHINVEEIEAKGKDYYYSATECKDCGTTWLN